MARLRLFLALFVVAGLAEAVLPAQLAGEYTIDPNGTGSRNYKSFAAANAALTANGINGPVRFTARFASRSESFRIDRVSGTSRTNTITLRGQTGRTKLSGPGSAIVTIVASDVILEGFEISRSGSAGDACISASGPNLEIRNCKLTATGRDRGIRGGGAGWNIHHNEFYGNGTGVSRGGYAHHNKFVCLLTAQDACLQVGQGGVAHNNLITGTHGDGHVVYLDEARGDFWHNTISVSTSGAAIEVPQYGGTPPSTSMHNNIVDVRGRGVGIRVRRTTSAFTIFQPDFNLYSIASGKIGEFNGTTYTSLGSWSAAISNNGSNPVNDRNSFTGSPHFVSATDFHLGWDSPAINRADVKVVSGNGGQPVLTDLDSLYRGDMRDIGAYELAGYKYFGAGCGGTGGTVPDLEIQGDVGPGKFTRFYLTKAKPSATPLFVVGLQQTRFNFGGSCDLLTWPLVMLQGTTTSSTGASYIQFNLPLNQAVSGLTAFTQFAVADPGAGGLGFAMTRGGSIRL